MKRAYFLATAVLLAQAGWGASPAFAGDATAAAPSVVDNAMDMFDEGKLLATGGVSNIEGAGGGGLATWALITGYGTHDGFGLDAHITYLNFPAYTLTTSKSPTRASISIRRKSASSSVSAMAMRSIRTSTAQK
jgi:hypothetical protein